MSSGQPCTAAAAASPALESNDVGLRGLLADFSIEITPREAVAAPHVVRSLPAATAVYLPYLRNVPLPDTLHAARLLREAGMVPVPHLAARAFRDAQALRETLAALRSAADVSRVLVVGGDVPRPLGPFASAADLMRTGLLEGHGITEVAFAGYPEGHPAIPDTALHAAAQDKLALAAAGGLRVRWLTQLCFSGAPVAAWTRRMRAASPRAVVDAGVYGVTSVRTLMRYGQLCGVGASLRALVRDHKRVLSLHAVGDPLRMLRELAGSRQTDPICVPSRVHFFSLGAFSATAGWANAVARGEGGLA